jgi:hypothetical protein
LQINKKDPFLKMLKNIFPQNGLKIKNKGHGSHAIAIFLRISMRFVAAKNAKINRRHSCQLSNYASDNLRHV